MRKNIMLLVQHLSGGGAERTVANLSRLLAEKYNVFIVTYDMLQNPYPYMGNLININLPSGCSSLKTVTALKRIIKVRHLKKKLHINCCISFLPSADYINILSRHREKAVVSIRTNPKASVVTTLQRIRQKWVLHNADHVVALSEGVRREIIRSYCINPERVSTIYNPCDFDAYLQRHSSISSCDIQYDPSLYYLVAMGSMRYPKGHWHLLKAFKLIHDSFQNTRLLLIGDGEYKHDLHNLAASLGLNDAVIMPGVVSNPHELISTVGKIFLFTSVYEGFGNVILEAMGCALAVVSTDCPYGPREILSDLDKKAVLEGYELSEYGVLTAPFEEDEANFSPSVTTSEANYANAIKYLINHEDVRADYVLKGKARLNDFSNEACRQAWESVIDA